MARSTTIIGTAISAAIAIAFLRCGQPSDPYLEVKPPFKYSISHDDGVTSYSFLGEHKPPLRIAGGRVTRESASLILVAIGLPEVDSSGLNVESTYFSGGRVGRGRTFRSMYRWKRYPGGPLLFERSKWGCRWPGRSYGYDCLEKISVGRTQVEDLIEAELGD